jgi:hypothetical protein
VHRGVIIDESSADQARDNAAQSTSCSILGWGKLSLVFGKSFSKIPMFIALDQGPPNYGPRAASDLQYTFIQPANVINKC